MKFRLPVIKGTDRIPKEDAPQGYYPRVKDPKEIVDGYRYGFGRPSLM